MIIVAVLLLPLLATLLVVMDRVEERLLTSEPARPRHAGRRRHLRLVRGERRSGPAEHARVAMDDAGASTERQAA
ncbi:hypothetical protein ACFY0F_30465 [Streptomyces sp. NPDC001544]|uniref:hypothetical protein n=1 Tax=Streptomyces sp. NPDC001544 TaxID=3364584 RepID=UPI0036A307AE